MYNKKALYWTWRAKILPLNVTTQQEIFENVPLNSKYFGHTAKQQKVNIEPFYCTK